MDHCTDPVDSCGNLIPDPSCEVEGYENGLGPGINHVILMKWLNVPVEGTLNPEVWVFVDGYKGYRISIGLDGQKYSISWDLRKTILNAKAKLALVFPPTDIQVALGYQGRTVLANSINVVGNHLELLFVDLGGEGDATCHNEYVLCLYDCCPAACTKPYDNTVFCFEPHNENSFAIQAATDPGLAKQVFLATEAGVQPIRGIALTRSGDAFDADSKLLYGSQKWVMVWDFEQGRLMDFFPQEWLRYGAAFYYQNQTLRKEIKAGFSNRKPYYLEVVDLGLVNSPQGSYDLDLDANGQRTHNWDVPSRILALHREGQQRAVGAWGMPRPVGAESLYTEFNHVSVDAYQKISDESAPALRQRFFEDRNLFLNFTVKQKHHDQIMFLTKEVAERTLRAMQDMVDSGRSLVDTFNPETQDSFGFYMIAILNVISQKMLKAKADSKMPNFGNFSLEDNEATMADWQRFAYGELRRLVEITKIDKKDFQMAMFQALKNVDPNNPTNLLAEMQKLIDPVLLKQEYDIAAEGRIGAGGGVTDPDVKTENQLRGLSTPKTVKTSI